MKMKEKNQLLKFVQKCCNTLTDGDSEESRKAIEYLSQTRGIPKDDFGRFLLGYCPKLSILPPEVRQFGNELLEDNAQRDLTRCIVSRIVLPICDEFGECVGLATRPPESGPDCTWWNLPAPFYKGHYLYLLDKARKAAFTNNKIYIVEGYMDAITLYLHGLHNVVAVMSTKLSHRQCALMARYCANVCVCFDVDANESGQKGTDRAVAILHRVGVFKLISVIDGLPVKEDPDSYVKKNGLESFLNLEKHLTGNQLIAACRRSDEQ